MLRITPDHPRFRELAERAGLLRYGFNPEEPRDKVGKWTKGGGATVGKESTFTVGPHQYLFKINSNGPGLQGGDVPAIIFGKHTGTLGYTYKQTPLDSHRETMQVFRTVADRIRAFVEKKRPPEFTFSAGQNEKSRVRLYDKFAQKIESATDYKLVRWESGGNVHYNFVLGDPRPNKIPFRFDMRDVIDALGEPGSYRERVRLLRYDRVRVPKGYTHEKPLVVQGKPYVGGEFVPGDVAAAATPEEKAALRSEDPSESAHLKSTARGPTANAGYWNNLLERQHETVADLLLPGEGHDFRKAEYHRLRNPEWDYGDEPEPDPDTLDLESFMQPGIEHGITTHMPKSSGHPVEASLSLRKATKGHVVREMAKLIDVSHDKINNLLLDPRTHTRADQDDFVNVADPAERLVNEMLGQWAETSSDHSILARAIQQRTEKAFGIEGAFHYPDDPDTGLSNAQVDAYAEDHKDVIDSYVHASYDHTQKTLKDAGVEEMVLYRGMSLMIDESEKSPTRFTFEKMRQPGQMHGEKRELFQLTEDEMWQKAREHLGDAAVDEVLKNPMPGANLFAEVVSIAEQATGATMTGGQSRDFKVKPRWDINEELQLQPLSSFSHEYKAAEIFARSGSHAQQVKGVIMAMKVPRERIFATAITGAGCLNEGEVIVLGGKANAIMHTFNNLHTPHTREEFHRLAHEKEAGA